MRTFHLSLWPTIRPNLHRQTVDAGLVHNVLSKVVPADEGGSGDRVARSSRTDISVSYIPARDAVRPTYLQLVPRDERMARMEAIAAAVDEAMRDHVDEREVIPGRLDEWEDWTASGATLFRYLSAMSEPGTLNLPTRLLTPKVRGKLHDLIVALDEASAAVVR